MGKIYTFELSNKGVDIITGRRNSYNQTFSNYTAYGGTLASGNISYFSNYYYCSSLMFNKLADYNKLMSLPANMVKQVTLHLDINATSATGNYYYIGKKNEDGTAFAIVQGTNLGPFRRSSAADTFLDIDLTAIGLCPYGYTIGQGNTQGAYQVSISKAVLTIETFEKDDVKIIINGTERTGTPKVIFVDGQPKNITGRIKVLHNGEWK